MTGVNSAVVSLRGPVLLVPEGWSATEGTKLKCYMTIVLSLKMQLFTVLNCSLYLTVFSLCREHSQQGSMGWCYNDCCCHSLCGGHSAAIFGFS